MNYDSWKLATNIDSRTQILEDRCTDLEAFVDGKLNQIIAVCNRETTCQWEVEPALADFNDDDEIRLELTLRLKQVPVTGNASDLQELGLCLIRMGQALTQAAQGQQTQHGLKLASSVTKRDVGSSAQLG
jgi:hypothetical protein